MTTEQFASKYNVNLSDFIQEVMKTGIALTSKQQLNAVDIPSFIKIAKSITNNSNTNTMTTNANIIDIIFIIENGTDITLTIGGLTIIAKPKELLSNIKTLIKVSDICGGDSEDIQSIVNKIEDLGLLDIISYEYCKAHILFNSETGIMTFAEYEIRNCSLDVYKYIKALKSITSSPFDYQDKELDNEEEEDAETTSIYRTAVQERFDSLLSED